MPEWKLKEWRIPKRGEVVKDPDGILGFVVRSEGTFVKRKVWIENIHGTLIHSGEEAECFELIDYGLAIEFHKERYRLKGFSIGVICNYKNDQNLPLEIIQMTWNQLRFNMTFVLKDLKTGETFKTEDETLLTIFENDFLKKENIFKDTESGLKYKLTVNLHETSNTGWTNCGSPWEFNDKDSAILEVNNWKSRLKIRRVASALNLDWKISFPCWTIVIQDDTLKIVTIDSMNGAPGYFKTATLAALAIKMLEIDDLKNALSSGQDFLDLN